MSEIDISYKGSSIATMDASGTKTLLTAGKYCEDDIEVVYTRPSGGGGTVTLVPVAIRPDAEAWKTYTYNKLIVTDEGVTIPAYSTSNTALKSSVNLETLTLDCTTYDYFVVVYMLSAPIYSVSTPEKNKTDHSLIVAYYELINYPKGLFGSLMGQQDATVLPIFHANSRGILVYWGTSTNYMSANTGASSYGTYQTHATPTFSVSSDNIPATLTVASPTFYIRGNGSYLKSSVWSTITDVRYQYKIIVYRAPKANLNLDAWSTRQGLLYVENSYHNNNGILV